MAAPSSLRLPLWRRTASALLRRRPLAPASAPASHQVRRGFAQERPQDSSASNWGAGEPPIDEKATERGAKPDSDSGEVPTPSLTRQKSTRDFINIKREERLKAAQGASPEVEKMQKMHEEVKETGAAHPGNIAGGLDYPTRVCRCGGSVVAYMENFLL